MTVSTGGVREERAWGMLPPLLHKTPEARPEKSVKANLWASLRQVVVMKSMSQRQRRQQETHSKARREPCPTGTAQRERVWKDPDLAGGGQFLSCREEAPVGSSVGQRAGGGQRRPNYC